MNDDEWEDLLLNHDCWLEEDIVPILSQKEMNRRKHQQIAESQPDSVSVFMIKVVLKLLKLINQLRDWNYDQEELLGLSHTCERSEPKPYDIPLDRSRPGD